jgi:hypothetical protein
MLIYPQTPLGNWQAGNWDPEINQGREAFDEFCAALTTPMNYAPTNGMGIGFDEEHELHFTLGPLTVPWTVMNYGKYIKEVGCL